MARALGRKSEQIALSLRWNGFPDLTERKNVTIVRDKLHEYNEIGVKHICIDLNIPQPVPVSFMIESMERLMEDVVPSL